MNQDPLDSQANQSPQGQPSQKAGFWKSKDPTVVLVRILLIIFIGLPLLGIIIAIILMILSSIKH